MVVSSDFGEDTRRLSCCPHWTSCTSCLRWSFAVWVVTLLLWRSSVLSAPVERPPRTSVVLLLMRDRCVDGGAVDVMKWGGVDVELSGSIDVSCRLIEIQRLNLDFNPRMTVILVSWSNMEIFDQAKLPSTSFQFHPCYKGSEHNISPFRRIVRIALDSASTDGTRIWSESPVPDKWKIVREDLCVAHFKAFSLLSLRICREIEFPAALSRHSSFSFVFSRVLNPTNFVVWEGGPYFLLTFDSKWEDGETGGLWHVQFWWRKVAEVRRKLNFCVFYVIFFLFVVVLAVGIRFR